jgi:hypothetical protein
MDRQVEVVAGKHVVVRVAGTVVLVGHRGRGRVTADAPAMRAAEALAQLVFEATEQAPDGPGWLVAREVTRWLMRDAEQISPGHPIDLGILSRADTGGVAIFLHGAVTAVLAGELGVEYYRGVDVAFTVDRVAESPARAVAVFIDDERGGVPDLPERGIGSLVEGVAPAAGAIVWFERQHSRARGRAAGASRSGPALPGVPPTAQLQQQRPAPENEEAYEVAGPAFDPHLEPTELSGPARSPFARYESNPLGGTPPNPWGTAAPTPPGPPDGVADPRRPGGTNPVPAPGPELERRLEATTRATPLVVKVMGFKCARTHPSDPRAAFCTVCGMPVDQTQQPAEVIRPPLGILVLDDGMTYLLAADAVIGRDPENSEAARRGLAPLKIDDASGGMSRAHAEILLVNWDVTIVDRGSTNGTRVRVPGYRDVIRLQPNQAMVLVHGSEIMLGNRALRFDPAAPPPFG